ncbi:MAG: hypothetical protein CR988_07915 [Treponema sp.]|nr:MAG: hypothetical protein CR988_07915 [Treponema sp.]
MIAEINTNLEKANQQMKEFYSVDVQRALYIAAQNAESDRVSMLGASRREVIREGIQKGIFQTAKNMKRKNFDSAVISEVTGLSIEEIEKL